MKYSFPHINKTVWNEKILKDLKRDSIKSFDHKVTETLFQSPFINHEDLQDYSSIRYQEERSNNSWQIIEKFKITDPEKTNKEIQNALNLGCNAIILDFEDDISSNDLNRLFKNINPTYIHCHLSGDTKTVENTLRHFIEEKHNTLEIKGSISSNIDGALRSKFAAMRFHLNTIKDVPFANLYEILKACHTHICNNHKKDVFANHLQIECLMTDNYLQNIATIRATRLLWIHLCEAFKIDLNPIAIIAKSSASHSLSIEEQYIYSSIHMMSAIIGSADGIYITAPTSQEKSSSFLSRITRNLHHLAAMEGYLTSTIDPLQGSYYIENLSNRLAEQAWNKFLIELDQE